jgi:DNA-binding SARP family transcriptional activator
MGATSWSFELDPTEQFFGGDGLDQSGVVLSHVVSNGDDDEVVGVATSDEATFTTNQSGHDRSPSCLYGKDVGPRLQKPWRLAPVRIQVCGSIVVEDHDQRLERSLPSRQGRLLFVYLVVHRDRQTPRPEIIEALWPNGGPEDADGALNALLSRLRRALGSNRIESRGTLRLALGDDASVDLEDADEAIRRAESAVALGEWERAWAASLVSMFVAKRGFLPGEDAIWIDQIRRHLDELHIRSLETYGTAGLGLGGTELAAAHSAGRTLVRLAPLREGGHRLLMRALVAEGNTAEALRVYENLRCLLRDELGVTPSDASQELHRQLLG